MAFNPWIPILIPTPPPWLALDHPLTSALTSSFKRDHQMVFNPWIPIIVPYFPAPPGPQVFFSHPGFPSFTGLDVMDTTDSYYYDF